MYQDRGQGRQGQPPYIDDMLDSADWAARLVEARKRRARRRAPRIVEMRQMPKPWDRHPQPRLPELIDEESGVSGSLRRARGHGPAATATHKTGLAQVLARSDAVLSRARAGDAPRQAVSEGADHAAPPTATPGQGRAATGNGAGRAGDFAAEPGRSGAASRASDAAGAGTPFRAGIARLVAFGASRSLWRRPRSMAGAAVLAGLVLVTFVVGRVGEARRPSEEIGASGVGAGSRAAADIHPDAPVEAGVAVIDAAGDPATSVARRDGAAALERSLRPVPRPAPDRRSDAAPGRVGAQGSAAPGGISRQEPVLGNRPGTGTPVIAARGAARPLAARPDGVPTFGRRP